MNWFKNLNSNSCCIVLFRKYHMNVSAKNWRISDKTWRTNCKQKVFCFLHLFFLPLSGFLYTDQLTKSISMSSLSLSNRSTLFMTWISERLSISPWFRKVTSQVHKGNDLLLLYFSLFCYHLYLYLNTRLIDISKSRMIIWFWKISWHLREKYETYFLF